MAAVRDTQQAFSIDSFVSQLARAVLGVSRVPLGSGQLVICTTLTESDNTYVLSDF